MHAQFQFYIQVSDMGIEDGGTIWFSSVYSSNEFHVVDLKQFTVNHPATKTCNVEPILSNGTMENGFVLSVILLYNINVTS